MQMNVYVGSGAVDTEQAWVRFHLPNGSLKTLPWAAIKMGALPNNDSHMKFQGDLGAVTKLRDTHDALWVEHSDGMDIVMLEKDNPKRDAVIEAFQQQLGSRWLGSKPKMQDLAALMFHMPQGAMAGGRMMKMMLMAVGAFILLTVAAILISKLAH